MTADQIGVSLLLLGIALLVAMAIRTAITPLQKIFMPSSIIAGLLLMVLGEDVLGQAAVWLGGEGNALSGGLFPEYMIEVWDALPELLISVIFASLFLGKEIFGVKKIWGIAGPQVTFGQMLGWGQYVLGILLAVLVLVPVFDMNPAAGALVEISFAGGHGTAAGLAGTFENLDFAEGTDLALGLATISMLSGVLICILIINWGVRNKKIEHIETPGDMSKEELKGVVAEEEEQDLAGRLSVRPEAMEPFSLHIGVIGAAILLGFLLLEGMVLLESWTWANWWGSEFMEHVPLFTFAMLGSVIIQVILDKLGKGYLLSRGLIVRIQGWSLDFLIVSAIGSLSLAVIGEYLIPFLLIALVGLGWSVFTFFVLAPRMIPKHWFERGMADLGQSLGMTATGLLMLRIVDGNNKTQSVESFGYKQLLFEPLLGGGIFTALSVPLLVEFGPYPLLVLTSVLCFGWLALGLFYFGKKKED